MSSPAATETMPRFWSQIDMMADLARILRDRPPGNETIRTILDLIAKIIPLDAVTLYLLDHRKDKLNRVAGHGKTIELCDFISFDRGDGLSGWVARQKRPVVIQGRDPETDGVRDHHDSVMILPLTGPGELIGVLCCSCGQRMAFDAHKQKLMEIVADQVAISLERVLHRRELEARDKSLTEVRDELKKTREQTVSRENLEAVSDLAVSISDEVSHPLSAILSNARIIELETAGLPEKLTRRIEAIVEGAKRFSLIAHKLQKMDRLIAESCPAHGDRTMINSINQQESTDDDC